MRLTLTLLCATTLLALAGCQAAGTTPVVTLQTAQESRHPILGSGGLLRFCDDIHWWEFRLPTAADARNARIMLTTEVASHPRGAWR